MQNKTLNTGWNINTAKKRSKKGKTQNKDGLNQEEDAKSGHRDCSGSGASI